MSWFGQRYNGPGCCMPKAKGKCQLYIVPTVLERACYGEWKTKVDCGNWSSRCHFFKP